jgi:ABC-type oligopeptide transport system substrate-binding subunit
VSANPVANFLDKVGQGSFGIYLVTWGADFADPSSLLGLFTTDAGANWGGYSNPQYDAALTAAATTDATDADARFADLVAAQQVLLTDQGITPVYFQSSTLLRNPELHGVVSHTAGPALELKAASKE